MLCILADCPQSSNAGARFDKKASRSTDTAKCWTKVSWADVHCKCGEREREREREREKETNTLLDYAIPANSVVAGGPWAVAA